MIASDDASAEIGSDMSKSRRAASAGMPIAEMLAEAHSTVPADWRMEM